MLNAIIPDLMQFYLGTRTNIKLDVLCSTYSMQPISNQCETNCVGEKKYLNIGLFANSHLGRSGNRVEDNGGKWFNQGAG